MKLRLWSNQSHSSLICKKSKNTVRKNWTSRWKSCKWSTTKRSSSSKGSLTIWIRKSRICRMNMMMPSTTKGAKSTKWRSKFKNRKRWLQVFRRWKGERESRSSSSRMMRIWRSRILWRGIWIRLSERRWSSGKTLPSTTKLWQILVINYKRS